ncbi:MAG: hypothetical protein U9R53_02600 [Chloroflexota bacterium]|nr:hypothetical protein [Chloroflexota bacterium]
MNTKQTILCLLIGLVFLVSCGSNEPIQDPPSSEPAAYPVQEGESSYPVAQTTTEEETGYPINEAETSYIQGPEFKIDEPVTEGDMIVTGIGPANVPIRLVDVSEVGLILSETLIEPDGVFEFSLEEPLVSSHSIGLQLGDIKDTEFNESDFLYSDSYYERPLIGVLFDLVVVE